MHIVEYILKASFRAGKKYDITWHTLTCLSKLKFDTLEEAYEAAKKHYIGAGFKCCSIDCSKYDKEDPRFVHFTRSETDQYLFRIKDLNSKPEWFIGFEDIIKENYAKSV